MQDARYFRMQAEFCLKLARQLSDPQAAEKLRASAARHSSRALDLEKAAAKNAAAAPRKKAAVG